MTESYIFMAFIILLIAIALWLILRQVFLWYWKVNKIVELLERNNSLLETVLIGKNIINPNKQISESKENNYKDSEKITKKSENQQDDIEIIDKCPCCNTKVNPNDIECRECGLSLK